MRRTTPLLSLLSLLILGACESEDFSDGLGLGPSEEPSVQCVVPTAQLFDGGPGKDGIPALTDPAMVGPQDPEAEWLEPQDRVVGLVVDGQAFAIPHAVSWWHEIVNLNVRGHTLAVTYCPLTGSSLAFDRQVVGGDEFGVSGLLYQSNLVLYNRSTRESLWSQMGRVEVCGVDPDMALPMVPVFEMTWEGWRTLHPETRVPAHLPGADQLFGLYQYPYGDYEESEFIFFPVNNADDRRPPKERVLGIPGGERALPGSSPGTEAGGGESVAFPFGELDGLGPVAAVHTQARGEPVVVFWSREWQGAAAFRPVLDGEPLTFRATDATIVDEATGSEWRLDGQASSGPLAGHRLPPVAEAYVAFWFAWGAFHPESRLWTGEES
ncbi:MAG: DUF3179 domain-containing protein [Gemmatimonadota bacterium]